MQVRKFLINMVHDNKGDNNLTSYERRAYESVDENSLS